MLDLTPYFPGAYILDINPEDITSLSTAATGTYPSAAQPVDGDPLRKVFNTAIANTYDFVRVADGTRPTYRAASVLNGKPCIEFRAVGTPSAGSGPYLLEAIEGGLATALGNSWTLLMVIDKRGGTEGTIRAIFGNSDQASDHFQFSSVSSKWNRHAGGGTLPTITTGMRVLGYSNTNTFLTKSVERILLDSSVPAVTRTNYLPPANLPTTGTVPRGFGLGNYAWGGGAGIFCMNADLYRLIAVQGPSGQGDWAGALAAINAYYSLSTTTTVGTLAAPNLYVYDATPTTLKIVADPQGGGTRPFTVQLYRSATLDTAANIAVVGNLISSSFNYTFTDTGLTAQSTYYYVMRVTATGGATVLSAVLTARTDGTITVLGDGVGDSTSTESPSFTLAPKHAEARIQRDQPPLNITIEGKGVVGRKARELSTATHAGGTNGGGQVTALVTAAVAAGKTFVSIRLGINDYTAWLTQPTDYTILRFKADIASIVAAYNAAGIIVYVHPILARVSPAQGFAASDDPTTGIPAWNDALFNATTGLTFNHLCRRGAEGLYNLIKNTPSLLTTDGLHPNGDGLAAIGEMEGDAMGPGIHALYWYRRGRSRNERY